MVKKFELESASGEAKKIREFAVETAAAALTFKKSLLETLLFTLFSDKATLIHNCERWSIGRDVFDGDFRAMQTLRNHLAHANDYAATPEAASETCRSARLIERWTDKLLELLEV